MFGSSYDVNQDSNYKGINTFVLNVNEHSISGWRRFDTWADVNQAYDFIEYFNQLRDGAVLIGVTADEPFQYLDPALRLLKAAGVDLYDVHGKGLAGKFAFILQKGYPEKTLMRKHNAGGNALELNISITGNEFMKTMMMMTMSVEDADIMTIMIMNDDDNDADDDEDDDDGDDVAGGRLQQQCLE